MKRVRVLVMVILIAAVSFGAGLWVQRQFQLVPLRLADQFARDLAGLDKPVPPAPAFDTWRYPQSTEGGSLVGTSVRYNGVLVRPPIRMAASSSTDSFETIALYYAEKLGFTEAPDVAASHAGTQSEGSVDGEQSMLLDSGDWAMQTATDTPGGRVRLKTLVRRSPAYDVLVMLSQADGSATTHLVLFYTPRVE